MIDDRIWNAGGLRRVFVRMGYGAEHARRIASGLPRELCESMANAPTTSAARMLYRAYLDEQKAADANEDGPLVDDGPFIADSPLASRLTDA